MEQQQRKKPEDARRDNNKEGKENQKRVGTEEQQARPADASQNGGTLPTLPEGITFSCL